MRVEPYSTGSIIHVVKRGTRGLNIVSDEADKWQFVKSLFLLNDAYRNENWRRETSDLPLFVRPPHWPERKTLTQILAWVLMPNHFHILAQEKTEGGTAKFMQRLCGSMSLCFNLKYQATGTIFQGSYKAKTVDDDAYLMHLLFYIQVKNVLELYPGGLIAARDNFDEAWNWALKYKFSSFPVYANNLKSPILDSRDNMIAEIHDNSLTKEDAYEMLCLYVSKESNMWQGRLQELSLE